MVSFNFSRQRLLSQKQTCSLHPLNHFSLRRHRRRTSPERDRRDAKFDFSAESPRPLLLQYHRQEQGVTMPVFPFPLLHKPTTWTDQELDAFLSSQPRLQSLQDSTHNSDLNHKTIPFHLQQLGKQTIDNSNSFHLIRHLLERQQSLTTTPRTTTTMYNSVPTSSRHLSTVRFEDLSLP
jgi:hypothetical protein